MFLEKDYIYIEKPVIDLHILTSNNMHTSNDIFPGST